MIALSIDEAVFFRILAGFFGEDRVIPQMSVFAVCGGEFPRSVPDQDGKLKQWSKANKCLFTIVDQDDIPRMVVEFFSGFEDSVEFSEVEHQRYLKPILDAVGVNYITISKEELEEITTPGSSLDFYTLLKAKVEEVGNIAIPD